jgi:hypothetical protein
LDSSITFSVKSPMKVSTLKLCWTKDSLISNPCIAYDVRRTKLTSRFLTCFASGESLLITLEFLLVSLRSGFFGAEEAPPRAGPCIVMLRFVARDRKWTWDRVSQRQRPRFAAYWFAAMTSTYTLRLRYDLRASSTSRKWDVPSTDTIRRRSRRSPCLAFVVTSCSSSCSSK